MTDKEVIFLLGACPPGGGGGADPEFAEALAQAARDPLLEAWFEDQRRFDSAIAARLQALPVPADLRSRILAGGRVSRPVSWLSARRLWAIAAMVTLFAGLGLWFAVGTGAPSEQWESHALAGLTELVAGREEFDAMSPRVTDLQQWLGLHGSPSTGAAALPARLRGLASLGCKTLMWHGHPISIICFHGPGGEMVHLAMVDRAALESPPPDGHPVFEEKEGWRIASWSQDGLSMMLVTKAPQSQLRALLGLILLP